MRQGTNRVEKNPRRILEAEQARSILILHRTMLVMQFTCCILNAHGPLPQLTFSSKHQFLLKVEGSNVDRRQCYYKILISYFFFLEAMSCNLNRLLPLASLSSWTIIHENQTHLPGYFSQ
jgi:hypothetical protein